MPTFFSTVSKAFRALDLFPTAKLVRYNGQTQYNSTTGGFISVIVITIFIILFASMGLRTVKRQIIQSQIQKVHESTPSELQVTMNQQSLMFTVMLLGFDLNTTPKLFDFSLKEQTYTTGFNLSSQTTVGLVQCTQAHFSHSAELKSSYYRLNFNRLLCPPLGHSFSVQGKASGDLYKHFTITVDRCNATTDPTCMDDATFAAIESSMGQFTLAVPLINTNINPDSANYKEFYLADYNFFRFSSQLGISAFGNIQEDTIQTDESLLPYEDIKTEKITHIPETMTSSVYLKTPNQFNAQVIFRKSPVTIKYKRTFNKIDTYFSYVGGLVGTIIGLIFIMGPYTEKAYEISLAKKVMVDNDKEQISSKYYNVGYFVLSYVKDFLDFINVNPDWPKVQKYMDVSDQITNQIDVTYIVRKMMFMDAAISKLMEKHEFQTICMRQKPTLDQAKEDRKMHFWPQIFKQQKQQERNQSEHPIAGSTLSPKQRLMEDSLGSSPTNLKVEKKEERNNQNIEEEDKNCEQDVSAMDFSQKEVKVENIKLAVSKVKKEGKQGKQISKQIMEQVDPEFLNKIEEKKQRKARPNLVEIQDIKPQDVSFEDKGHQIIKVANLDLAQKEKKAK